MSSAAVQQSGPPISSRTQYQQPSSSYYHHQHQHQHQQQQPPPPQQQQQQQQQASSSSSAAVAAAAGPHQTSSPSQQRRASRRPSGNGECTPQQPHHYSPSTSNASDATTPRAHPGPTSNHASPASTPSAYNPHQAAPVPPPRTSSAHKATAAPQDPYTTSSRPPSSRAASQHMREDPAQSAVNAAHRRRSQQSSKEPSYQPTASSKNSPSHSRSATAVGSTPMGSNLPREDSTVINRLVIADPSEDFAREQARMVETRPQAGGTDITPITGLGLVGSEGVDDGGRGGGKSRQDHSRDKPRRETKFGDYILGQTLGEGEFGKVKMGWKKDGGVQVAIKLIRREVLGSNPSRLPKIYREISILRGLQHPNIVRLHEMVETERHIGIILEYASGGELFDYILNHRYLKDNSARRLFAQLVSGVGYLHKKGIVHRDLKLENLLLDRNKNIIITDFGFANTFDPNDDLGDEIEYNLGNKDFVKKMGLDLVGDSGHRRGDLMQTSCGSPCYAAPELVVSDSLYTGRKVDVWSCGVILYAMLAGYLPFDDDPANPEGDNINLLYKYIVSTPLTFPEYVTPHARDLLKRILVPDPRKRADLFEVARHSWLSEYAHVVGFITSSTTTSSDIANTTVPAEDPYEVPQLARSASVREANKPTHVSVAGVGGLHQKHGHIDQADTGSQAKRERDAKRRTVQVEYVAPHTQTQRGEASPPIGSSSGTASQGGASRTRLRVENQGPVEVPSTDGYTSASANPNRMSTGAVSAAGVPPTRPTRETQRAVSDVPFSNQPITSSARPSTGGTMSGSSRLPSRGNSYGQPVAATVAATNAQGRFSQPKGKQYVISAPMPQDPAQQEAGGRTSMQRESSSTYQPVKTEGSTHSNRVSHRRSNTVSGFGEKIFRASGIFSSGKPVEPSGQKQKSYPPVSMTSSIPSEGSGGHRRSAESSRRTSFNFNRKTSENAPPRDRSSRRFSLLPAAFSMKNFASNKEPGAGDRRSYQPPTRQRASSRTQMGYGRDSPSPSPSTTNSTLPTAYNDELERQRTTSTRDKRRSGLFSGLQASAPTQQPRYPAPTSYPNHGDDGYQSQQGGFYNRNEPDQRQQAQQLPHRPQYPPGFDSNEQLGSEPSQGRARVLQKNRRFADAYEDQQRYAGSSGAARRVMDLFRRRGKARGG
ncbi:hypothetical protein IWX49DRAFT_178174 [Phyllosticta citricarpa]|uniref:Protein kinase domain-containing protein n=1 Tax=Phyllosticta citricarpa TaxID=55181 RepID=A0ABR1M2A1_9PEZI